MTILERTDKIEELYRAAKVVLVPSYRFVETFSRVRIEAQRFGKPVIGADVGNIPNLLGRSGVVLPNKLDAWVAELSQLFQDDAYYAGGRRPPPENSDRYSHSGQHKAIAEVVRAAGRVLPAGYRLGHWQHDPRVSAGTPSVRKHRAEDRSGRCGGSRRKPFLLHNSKWVNAVFSLRNSVLSRRYDTVFVTHCFGSTRVPFRARRVIWARDWDDFHADHRCMRPASISESAKQLLRASTTPRKTSGTIMSARSTTSGQTGSSSASMADRRVGFGRASGGRTIRSLRPD